MNFNSNSFANAAEKKEVMLAVYKAAMLKMYDERIIPVQSNIDLGGSTLSFVVRANEADKAMACLNNLAA